MFFIEKYNKNAKYNVVFLPGWGRTHQDFNEFSNLFAHRYSIFLLDLPGFGRSSLVREYTISDYIEDIHSFIESNNLENVVLIGHSFGGKIAAKYCQIHHNTRCILIAPSLLANPNSWKAKIKIALYKIFKKLHLPICRWLKGSKDYQNAKGFLKKTLVNVCHEYLNNEEIMTAKECLLIGFKDDKQVSYMTLEKIAKMNPAFHYLPLEGDHFGFFENALEIYHFSCLFIESEQI